MNSKNTKTILIPLTLGIITTAAIMFTASLWNTLEMKAYDFRLSIVKNLKTERHVPSGKVVVVGLEDKYLSTEKPLIFWYPDIGRFIMKMSEYRAKSIGIDLIPIHSLGQKIQSAAKEIVGPDKTGKYSQFLDMFGEESDNSLLKPLIVASEIMPVVQGVSGENTPFYINMMPFMKNVKPASVNLLPDKDHVIRRYQLAEVNSMASFAYSLYRTLEEEKRVPDILYVNYLLLKNLPYYSLKDVLKDKIPAREFADKIVILGFISSNEDVHPTPLQYQPGVFIHAIAVDTLLTKTAVTKIYSPVQTGVLVLLVGISFLLSIKRGPLSALSGITLISAVFFIANLFIFAQGYLFTLFPHLISPFLLFAVLYPYRYVVEEKNRRMILRTFGYYIDPRHLDAIIGSDPGSLFRGETRDMCILFLDIRDFTKFSRTRKAEEIVDFLNKFFEIVIEPILKNGGFVNKFLGDGILAFFSLGQTPVRDAIIASKEIIRAVERANTSPAFAGFVGDWTIHVGIGIHFGSVVIGNIGSKKKMDLTIIGNPVNIASRIEGLTKQFRKSVLLSDKACIFVKDEFDFRYLGETNLKGIDEPIGIYTFNDEPL
ncbi:MAG: hypothetical protein C0392_04810 [Syntrophus sp. (in: bacteria)]|nr:hypothetical protein [Syntrophus sp. (in: bacteria)]